MEDSTCQKCPSHTRAQENGKRCGADECEINEVQLEDGTCGKCESYMRRSLNGFKCIQDTCTDK